MSLKVTGFWLLDSLVRDEYCGVTPRSPEGEGIFDSRHQEEGEVVNKVSCRFLDQAKDTENVECNVGVWKVGREMFMRGVNHVAVLSSSSRPVKKWANSLNPLCATRTLWT
ncbi:hypothetical protein Salat_1559600 [Sesamum alatum]|uniref:Uncharacterized protein n=1 Tax=Sesamum alatum TaxID=300844 RepID=A0AAE1YDM0_9LAMI|nr:hypothetical protein Salat_1559600 [Sesamum alatum]